MTYTSDYPTRTLAECAAENRAAREALERSVKISELRKADSIIWNLNKLRVRMTAAIQFGKEQETMSNQTTPTLEQAARELQAALNRIISLMDGNYYICTPSNWEELTAEQKDHHPYCTSYEQARAALQKYEHAALNAQDEPRNTMSVLCKRDLHRECDDATYCACGCHLKPAIYTR